MRLLLVEDDPAMQLALGRALERRGIDVVLCGTGHEALKRWPAAHPDVVALDLNLPDRDGLDILATARVQGLDTPVLLLTARSTVGDRVIGLNAGADDYLTKPFDLDELEARLHALSRRRGSTGGDTRQAHSSNTAVNAIGHLRLDRESGAIYIHDRVLELTPRESALLAALLMRPGQAVSRERLFQVVFQGEANVQADAIEVVVYRVRRKLAQSGTVLVTLRGLGYLLKASS